jgi:hypothetical protein
MTPAEALSVIKRAAMTHQLKITPHARQRMTERRMRVADVEQACLRAPEQCSSSMGAGAWRART